MTLQQGISVKGLFFAAIGGIVGSGWLFGPLYAAHTAGPAAVVSWLLGGVLMMIIAFTFAELSTAYPVAGGVARFMQFSHGRLSSFTLAWVSWLAAIMVAPIETMAAVQYAGNYFPSLMVKTDHAAELTGFGIAIAIGIMLLMCIMNTFAVRFFSKSNSIIVSWKLIVPVLTCIVLMGYHFEPANFTAMDGFAPSGWHGILQALPVAGIIFSYIGYSPAIQLAAEAKNPQRAIPFAIIGAVLFAIFLYVFIQIAFIGALDLQAQDGVWAHLSFQGDAGPVAGIVMGLGAAWLLKMIYIDAFISPLGTAYVYTFSTARVNMAMTENQYMPAFMTTLNRHGAPVRAIAVNFIAGVFFFLPFPGWQEMVSFIISCFVISFAIGPIACVVLRITQPHVVRPFKVPCVKTFCALAFIICNLIIYWAGWDIVWKMLLTMLIGYAVLGIHDKLATIRADLDIKKALWLLPYLSGMGLISYLGAFGGGKLMIPFGYDILVVAVFSLLVFYSAIACALYRPSEAKAF